MLASSQKDRLGQPGVGNIRRGRRRRARKADAAGRSSDLSSSRKAWLIASASSGVEGMGQLPALALPAWGLGRPSRAS